VRPEVIAQPVAQASGAVAVDEPQARRAAHDRLIERLLRGVDRLLQAHADEVDLGGVAGDVPAVVRRET
jgi:hypothetical protein